MRDLEKCTDHELRAMSEAIESSCRHFKTSHDGSYQMALEQRGFYDIENELLMREVARED